MDRSSFKPISAEKRQSQLTSAFIAREQDLDVMDQIVEWVNKIVKTANISDQFTNVSRMSMWYIPSNTNTPYGVTLFRYIKD